MGPWLDSDPAHGWADDAEALARRNRELRAEVERLRGRAERMESARRDLRDAHAHFAFVHLLGESVDHAGNGRHGRSPRIELNAAIRAMVADLDAEPADEGTPAIDPANPPLRRRRSPDG